jgi:hypothetical protein
MNQGVARVSDDSLFREVDEEVRQEQLKKLWARYGGYVVALSIGVVIAVAAIKGWQYWELRQAEAAARSYGAALTLISEGKRGEADAELKAITHAGFGRIAKLRRAANLATEGKSDEAVALYDEAAADTGADSSARDLARIRAGYLLVDKLGPADLKARVGPLDNDTSEWRGAAREIVALAAYRTGDYATADRYANAILADAAVPMSIRQRARLMVDLLTPLIGAKAQK